MEDIVTIASEYAIKCHKDTNHMYDDGVPYKVHLENTFSNGMYYLKLLGEISDNMMLSVMAACWTHDLIEDCRQSYNKVKDKCGIIVAEITYALTNEKGKTRSERGNDKYYEGITQNKFNVYVKLCDRLANVQYSNEHGSPMLDKYRDEHKEFIKHFEIDGYIQMFQPMFDELKSLLFD